MVCSITQGDHNKLTSKQSKKNYMFLHAWNVCTCHHSLSHFVTRKQHIHFTQCDIRLLLHYKVHQTLYD